MSVRSHKLDFLIISTTQQNESAEHQSAASTSTTSHHNIYQQQTTNNQQHSTTTMPSTSHQVYRKVEDLPGAKLGEQISHIFAGMKSRGNTPTATRNNSVNNSVQASRQPSPTREARDTTATADFASQQQTRPAHRTHKTGQYYAF